MGLPADPSIEGRKDGGLTLSRAAHPSLLRAAKNWRACWSTLAAELPRRRRRQSHPIIAAVRGRIEMHADDLIRRYLSAEDPSVEPVREEQGRKRGHGHGQRGPIGASILRAVDRLNSTQRNETV